MNETQIFIFDWDDTLFPTSYYKSYSIESFYYDILSSLILQIFYKCLFLGKLYIVTNSRNDWVLYLCSLYLPNVYNFLYKYNIKILQYTNNCLYTIESLYIMKQINFNTIYSLIFLDSPTSELSFFSFGDDDYERHALLSLSESNIIFKKNIKFISFPTLSDIVNQLNFINNNLFYLILSSYSFDICLSSYSL